MTKPLGIRSILRTLATGLAGVHSSHPDLAAWGSAAIGTQARKLAAKGELFGATIGTREVRYFTTPAARASFVAAHTPRPRGWRKGLMWGAVGRAPWADDAPTVIPEGLVIQHGPSHPPRDQAHTFSFVHHG